MICAVRHGDSFAIKEYTKDPDYGYKQYDRPGQRHVKKDEPIPKGWEYHLIEKGEDMEDGLNFLITPETLTMNHGIFEYQYATSVKIREGVLLDESALRYYLENQALILHHLETYFQKYSILNKVNLEVGTTKIEAYDPLL